jgi:hypothetical protein
MGKEIIDDEDLELSEEDILNFDDPGFDYRIDEEQNFIEEERGNDKS